MSVNITESPPTEVASPTSVPHRSRWRLQTRLFAAFAFPVGIAVGLGALRVHATWTEAGAPAAAREAVVIAALLFVALLLVIGLSASVVRQLRQLRASAFEVADHVLPRAVGRLTRDPAAASEIRIAPLARPTTDELGQTAMAIDALQQQALRLAAEQALLRANSNDITVGLSHRCVLHSHQQQQLLRQLGDGEQDPGRLARVIELDHLAAKLRRDSENLQVLVGQERRSDGSRPTALATVLRAVVEQADRRHMITVKPPAAVDLDGPLARDLIQLLVELMNHLTASAPPEATVQVSSVPRQDGAVGLEIAGPTTLSADEIVTASQWLSESPVRGAVPSSATGLLVAGRLAARHGVALSLDPHAVGVRLSTWLGSTSVTTAAPLPRT